MAITTSAPNGVQVTTPAVNETLGSQAQTNGSNQIVLSDTFANLNNGNVGNSTYVGRLVRLRPGTGTEEVKYCTAETAGTGTTVILTVHEPWDSQPVATTDSVEISYLLVDAATVTGLGLINKRNNDYSSTRRFRVVSTGFFAIVDGASLETVDNGRTTVADFSVETGALFQIGYLAGGRPISGGAIFGTPATNGELVFDCQSGGEARLYDAYVKCVFQNQMWFNGTAIFNRTKIYNGVYTMDLTGIVEMQDTAVEGTATTNETVEVDGTTDVQSLNLINCNGFIGPGTTDTITIRETNFLLLLRYILVNTNETWRIVDPVWDVDTASQNDIDFISATGTSVEELFSFFTTVTESDGTAIQNARVKIVETLLNDNIPHSGNTDSNGEYSVDILKRVFTDGSTVLTVALRGNFALRVFDYGNTPFVGALSVVAPIIQPLSLTADPAITEATAATAITNGSGILVERHATGETDIRPIKVLHYDGGTGSVPTIGETVTQGSASGTVMDYEGDATEGILVIELWNGTEFTNNSTITGGTSSFSATTDLSGDTLSFYQEYTWTIDADSKSFAILYDYLAARMAEATLTAPFEDVHIWGADEQAQLLYLTDTGYRTRRNVTRTEGVWILNRGAGAVAGLESDAGTLYTPPASRTNTVTGLDNGEIVVWVQAAFPWEANTAYIVGDLVTNDSGKIYRCVVAGTSAGSGGPTGTGTGITDNTVTWDYEESNLDGVELFQTTSSGGQAAYTYVYTRDLPVFINVLSLTRDNILIDPVTLGNADAIIPVTQQDDGVYSNP
jgi:hypothetical protein